MNEAEYLMKNIIMEIEEGVICRGLRPRQITPSKISISSYDTKAEFINCFIIHLE